MGELVPGIEDLRGRRNRRASTSYKRSGGEGGETEKLVPAAALLSSWSNYWQAFTLAATPYRHYFFFFNHLFFF